MEVPQNGLSVAHAIRTARAEINPRHQCVQQPSQVPWLVEVGPICSHLAYEIRSPGGNKH
jgi:hypothetical protein